MLASKVRQKSRKISKNRGSAAIFYDFSGFLSNFRHPHHLFRCFSFFRNKNLSVSTNFTIRTKNKNQLSIYRFKTVAWFLFRNRNVTPSSRDLSIFLKNLKIAHPTHIAWKRLFLDMMYPAPTTATLFGISSCVKNWSESMQYSFPGISGMDGSPPDEMRTCFPDITSVLPSFPTTFTWVKSPSFPSKEAVPYILAYGCGFLCCRQSSIW